MEEKWVFEITLLGPPHLEHPYKFHGQTFLHDGERHQESPVC